MKNFVGALIFCGYWLLRGIATVLVWLLLLGIIVIGAAGGRL